MRPCDAVKLIFQNEFGGGHFVSDEHHCLQLLTEEYASLGKAGPPCLFEPVGNGIVRLNLAAADAESLPPGVVSRLFISSAKRKRGSLSSFVEKLDVLRQATAARMSGFSSDELDCYLEDYKKSGFPAVSHSEVYRRAYRPAYRVIDAAYEGLLPVIERLSSLLSSRERVVIGIDGNAASGKTTSARLISEIYDGSVIHMDDFFLPPQLRTAQRYAEAGGNIHYERFVDEVVKNLKSAAPFTFRAFDCAALDYTEKKTIIPQKVTIVEGSYSLHPAFGDVYDIRVFLSVSEEEQKKRIVRRNGESQCRLFKDVWIPMENRYFERFAIKEKCDFCITPDYSPS